VVDEVILDIDCNLLQKGPCKPFVIVLIFAERYKLDHVSARHFASLGVYKITLVTV
jgi:hypothetical protein